MSAINVNKNNCAYRLNAAGHKMQRRLLPGA